MDLTKFQPGAKEGTIMTARCRLIYPSLFEATDMKGGVNSDDSKNKFRISVLIPESANVDALLKRVDEVIAAQAKKDQDIARKPFIKVSEQRSLAKYAEEYPVLIRCNSKYQPDVIGPDKRKLQEDECYSGRWGRITINPYWYPSIDGGKPGVALGLNNVQFLDHDDPIGGSRVSAEDEFEEIEGVDDEPAESSASSSDIQKMFG